MVAIIARPFQNFPGSEVPTQVYGAVFQIGDGIMYNGVVYPVQRKSLAVPSDGSLEFAAAEAGHYHLVIAAGHFAGTGQVHLKTNDDADFCEGLPTLQQSAVYPLNIHGWSKAGNSQNLSAVTSPGSSGQVMISWVTIPNSVPDIAI